MQKLRRRCNERVQNTCANDCNVSSGDDPAVLALHQQGSGFTDTLDKI